MKSTTNFDNLLTLGVEQYLKLNGSRIENVGESLIELDEKSIMLNCYQNEETLNYVPIFECETQGKITQYNSFEKAFEDFIHFEEGDHSAN
jgi:hypothetical protein